MSETEFKPARWQHDLYDLLRRNNITQFAYVPDAGHRILIDRSLADPGVCGARLHNGRCHGWGVHDRPRPGAGSS
jgi:hypothetical protein